VNCALSFWTALAGTFVATLAGRTFRVPAVHVGERTVLCVLRGSIRRGLVAAILCGRDGRRRSGISGFRRSRLLGVITASGGEGDQQERCGQPQPRKYWCDHGPKLNEGRASFQSALGLMRARRGGVAGRGFCNGLVDRTYQDVATQRLAKVVSGTV